MNMDGAGSYGVRDFVISNSIMWLRDYHMDGLRLDAVHAIYDEGPCTSSKSYRQPWPL